MHLARCMRACSLPLGLRHGSVTVRQFCKTPISSSLHSTCRPAARAPAHQRIAARREACPVRKSCCSAAASVGTHGGRIRGILRSVAMHGAVAAPQQPPAAAAAQDEVCRRIQNEHCAFGCCVPSEHKLGHRPRAFSNFSTLVGDRIGIPCTSLFLL